MSNLNISRDEVFSKEEIIQYFLGAYHSVKRIFKRKFEEYLYLLPTYCDHCKGRLMECVSKVYKCKGMTYISLACIP